MLLLVSTEKLSKIRGEIPGGFNSRELSFFCMLYPLSTLLAYSFAEEKKPSGDI